MGYYTRHELDIIYGNDYSIDYENEISLLAEYNNCFEEEIKWYNCENDMVEYSKKHPDTLFCIKGYGEESEDIWKQYFKNGKSFRTKAKIIFEEFTEDKLS